MMYLKIVAVAVALYLVLRFISTYFRLLTGKQSIRSAFLRIFPVVQLAAWLLYTFWTFDSLFTEKAHYPTLLTSTIVLLAALGGWYFLRDYIAGTILKAENGLEPGQQLGTSEISGTIKKLGYRSIEIIDNQGERTKIPYSLLIGQKLVQSAKTRHWNEQCIRLSISSAHPAEMIQTRIKERLLQMPWIASAHLATLTLTRESPDSYLAEVHLRLLLPEMTLKTEENLKQFVEEVFS